MAQCKDTSECAGQQVCSDGQCVESESTTYGAFSENATPPARRRTFATTAGEYIGQYRGEKQKLDEFNKFLGDQLAEAERKRKEEAEDIGFWGSALSFVGAAVGCIAASAATGGLGCTAGATIGAGLGSLGGRFGADMAGDAETYGLTKEELNRLSPQDLELLSEDYVDIQDDAIKVQQTLDDYDENQWKTHVLEAAGDAWTAYTVANMTSKIGLTDVGGKIGMFSEEAVKKTVEKEVVDVGASTLLAQTGDLT